MFGYYESVLDDDSKEFQKIIAENDFQLMVNFIHNNISYLKKMNLVEDVGRFLLGILVIIAV